MTKHIIIGAGPAGLTAAWQLAKKKQDVLVLEADSTYVGGIARTVVHKGNRFDIGGHRFYSKSHEINKLWHEMLPDNFITVQRQSRIYYNNIFFPYPINIATTLKNLGLLKSIKTAASFIVARLFPRRPEVTFEDIIINRFGRELYKIFFKSYSVKVWGIPCDEISKDFVTQRIRGLSFLEVVKNALTSQKNDPTIKTLINTFIYPRLGPGQLWEIVWRKAQSKGANLHFNKRVVTITHENGLVQALKTSDGEVYEGDFFYSTMCLQDFIEALTPSPPDRVVVAAKALRYRGFITVALFYDIVNIFTDNWLYIHDPNVKVGRIQNYKNWSMDMVDSPSNTCLGLEYFCNENDPLWQMSDNELIELGKEEIEKIGLANTCHCTDGCVVRVNKAYPLYDLRYREERNIIKEWLNNYFKNLLPAGRGGLHNYNSMDHSMMAALLAVRNMTEQADFDLWAINTEEEYAEAGNPSQTSNKDLH